MEVLAVIGEPWGEPVFWIPSAFALTIVVVAWLVQWKRNKRCPMCGQLTMKAEGNRLVRVDRWLAAGHGEHYKVVCQNCRFEESRQKPNSSSAL